jgi:hypothetical protein
MSPSIISMHQNFSNSPISSNELGISPLTIGATDQIPLAIAFQETIHVIMSGDNQEKYEKKNNYFIYFFLKLEKSNCWSNAYFISKFNVKSSYGFITYWKYIRISIKKFR